MFSDTIPDNGLIESHVQNLTSTFELEDNAVDIGYWRKLKEKFPNICSSSLKKVLFRVAEVKFIPHSSVFTSNPGVNFAISVDENINVTIDPRVLNLHWATKRCGAILACVQAICSDLQFGECRFSVCDTGDFGCLSFSLPGPANEMLIPDVDYITSFGYNDFATKLEACLTPWQSRSPTAFWRGSLILNVKQTPDDVSLESLFDASQRLRLCGLSLKEARLDARCTSIWVPNRELLPDILIRNYMGVATSSLESVNYKYLLDVDGFSNSWSGLFQKLLTGSPVLKVKSPNGFIQWYYNQLVPWVNYVPIGVGMSDISDVLEFLYNDEKTAQNIGENGRDLAKSLSYENQMQVLKSKIMNFCNKY